MSIYVILAYGDAMKGKNMTWEGLKEFKKKQWKE